MSSVADNGIVSLPSNHSVDEAVQRRRAILEAKGITLFALVDHSGEAEKVGMKMPPTKLRIFGDPKAGTSLMLAAPLSAIDLPLKIPIWEDGQGKTWISFNSSAYLAARHGRSPVGESWLGSNPRTRNCISRGIAQVGI
ncbi:MAG TPA: DUF302 domain-containing protein [Patescibacteria group bacterium]|nr:DUF302 domain-containing protein [Patescibacteria group bacterium]